MKRKAAEKLQLRLSTWEMNRIKGLARLYAGGNVSRWIRYAALHCERAHLGEDEESAAPRRADRNAAPRIKTGRS